MGNRLTPTLAIAYMDYIENRTFLNDVILYKRYIDDVIVIAKSKETLSSVYNSLNDVDHYIKLARETSENEWLPFLNEKN